MPRRIRIAAFVDLGFDDVLLAWWVVPAGLAVAAVALFTGGSAGCICWHTGWAIACGWLQDVEAVAS